MHVSSRNVITGGVAVMTVCLGFPLMAQAGSSNDYNEYEDRYDTSQREWADSRPGKHDVPIDRRSDNQQYYTDQYGDLDTIRTQENLKRNRSAGNWTNDGYRSNASGQISRNDNELRRSDATLRRNIIEELGGDYRNVRVNVRNGVATLTGTVEDRDEMVGAVGAAYDGGAQRVMNQLNVFRLDDRPWETMSDRGLERAVRDELSGSPFVESDRIRVWARQGIVTLEGSVEDRSEMAAAVDNAYEAGARRVDNQLRMMN